MSVAESSSTGEGPITLGINAVYHQSSAALVRSGVVVAAVEEERFNRRKGGKEADFENTLVLPLRSIESVLRAAGLHLKDVDFIGYSFSLPLRGEHEELWNQYPPILGGGYETPTGDRAFQDLLELTPHVIAGRFGLEASEVRQRFHWVPHHLSHLASAFYCSPFPSAAGLVIDGIGECDTTTLADCDADGIRLLESIDYPHSLGFLWEVLTNFLGFRGNHDESKIMGLAAYGDPGRLRPAMKQIVQVDGEGRFTTSIDPGVLEDDYSNIEGLFGFKRRLPYEPLAWEGRARQHADVAASLQEVTNAIFLRRARHVRQLTGRRHLVMAGGVTLNCVGNGLVAEHAGFDDIYVQPAAGDAGTAAGAALELYHANRAGGASPVCAMPHPYLGPEFTDAEIEESLARHRLHYKRVAEPIEVAARLLAEGKIVGWFQGRMEFGPRALGNRSLLANPTLPAVRHMLNVEVKHREKFRPFCPSILEEHADDWLEHERPFCQASKHMLATYRIRPEKRELVPAVIHLDGSARAQLVARRDNPMFHDLISAFHQLTGVPLLLNTSFNDREPIVCTPDHACRCFLKTRFDAFLAGPFLVTGPKPWERQGRGSSFELEARAFDSMGVGEE